MSLVHSIYALVDPNTREDRYVGHTSNGTDSRLVVHVSNARRAARMDGSEPLSLKSKWILSLLEKGQVPDVRIICRVGAREVLKRERLWIRRLVARGVPLLNIVHMPGYRVGRIWTEEGKTS